MVETGFSDFHKMTATVMKLYFKKQQPKIINYRDYRFFSNNAFRDELLIELDKNNKDNTNFDRYKEILIKILDKHAPVKQKYIRANQVPYMNKNLQKAVMKRTNLRNKYLKNKTESNKIAYNQQRNFCVKLFRKEKKTFYNNLDPKKVTDNKLFWKTVKPFLSDKGSSKEKITLSENDQIITEEKQIAEIFNEFFTNAVKNLDIPLPVGTSLTYEKQDNPVSKAIKRYENHPSIASTKKRNIPQDSFSLNSVSLNEIQKQINSLNPNKASQKTDIPTRIIKNNSDILSQFMYDNINFCLRTAHFPQSLKNAHVTPVFKRESRLDKKNYRPVSILPNISKIYERCIYNQISLYFNDILSKYQCGFRKGYNAQHCLIVMVEKWKRVLDKGGACGALLTDLSKAFDCLLHDLLIAKLHAYGFSFKSLRFLHDYLNNRSQCTKVNNAYSTPSKLKFGVPQGSILGPLLFNIYLCDLFLEIEDIDIASYADDNTPYVCNQDPIEVVEKLQNTYRTIFSWCVKNHMKANPDKCNLIFDKKNSNLKVNLGEISIPSNDTTKLLGVTIDNKLSFDPHVTNLCKKVSQKLSALSRISSYMTIEKRKLIMNAFINSQFGYCPLVWMFHSRALNSRINRLHERSLRLVYQDKHSSFQELLDKDCSVTIHHKNLQTLAVELFKVKNNIAPEIVKEIFRTTGNSTYNLRHKYAFQQNNVKTVSYGTESLAFIAPKLWNMIPLEIKSAKSLHEFKKRIKKWFPDKCPCRLCKNYIHQVGFI